MDHDFRFLRHVDASLQYAAEEADKVRNSGHIVAGPPHELVMDDIMIQTVLTRHNKYKIEKSSFANTTLY